MNLAFPALCILLLALPGIIFRKAYTKGAVPVFFPLGGSVVNGINAANKLPTSNRPVAEEVAASLIAAIVLHILWLTFSSWLHALLQWLLGRGIGSFQPDYFNVMRVLFGDLKTEGTHNEVMAFLASNRHGIVLYFMSLYPASHVFGRCCIRLVRRLRLDHKFMHFRLEDQWFYFLSGEMFSFAEFEPLVKGTPRVTGTYVSVVVTQTGCDYLYKGFLWDFHLNKEGNLDRLVLHNVIRCKFDPAEPAPSPVAAPSLPPAQPAPPERVTEIVDKQWQFQRVTSQVFTVKYADCKTLACTYFYIVPKAGESVGGRAVTA